MSALIQHARDASATRAALCSFIGAVFCVALFAHAAHAQTPAPPPGVPTGDARITGQVLHAESDAPMRGIEVALYALRENGLPGIARTHSDGDGRFEFAQISNDPNISYLLGARYRELPYPGERVVFAPGAQSAEAVIRVTELTPSPRALRTTGVSLRVRREARGLRVEHSVRTHNGGARTFYRGANARTRSAAFAITLPPDAREFEMPLGAAPEGLLREGRALSYFGPIHPGAHEFSFQYLLPGVRAQDGAETFTLQASAPTGTPFEVLLPRGLAKVQAPRLTRTPHASAAQNTRDMQGARDAQNANGEQRTRNTQNASDAQNTRDAQHASATREERWASAAGGAFEITLTLPPARRDPSAVRVMAARAVLRADDVALEVNETYTLEVRGDATQLADAARPFVLVTLPPGARALHFGSDAPGVTLEAHPAALPATADAPAAALSDAERAQTWLAAVGSVAPGRFQVGVRYQLAVDDARRAHFARRFAQRLPALSIFLADSGDLAPTSTRLHRRRPLREADRNYLHLEAFEVARGEVVELAIGRRARAGGARGPVALGAATLLALGAVLFLAAPLRAGDATIAREQSENENARERAALVAAIHDLDHDFETGKLSAPDHAELRDELRARAIETLRREREQSAASLSKAAQGDATESMPAPAQAGATQDAATRSDANQTGAALRQTQAGSLHGATEQTSAAKRADAAQENAAQQDVAARGDVNQAGAAQGDAARVSLCPQCGADALPAHRFCPECGARLSSDARA